MKSINPSYVRCFVKSAQALLDSSCCYKDMVPFANSINEKANRLLIRAMLNKSVDTEKLQRDLFETGREYIKKFVKKFHQNELVDNII